MERFKGAFVYVYTHKVRHMISLWFYSSLHTEQKEVSQEITNLTDKVQKVQRGLTTIKKALNEIESQISDLDAAKEIAKQGKDWNRIQTELF